MNVKSIGMLVLEGFVFCVLVVALVIFVQRYLIPSGVGSIQVVEKNFEFYKSSAGHFFKVNLGYSGLCHGIGLDEKIACADSEEGYRIEEKLESGAFYCMDSSGFIGEVQKSGKERFRCQ